MVERALLVVNRSSGVGHGREVADGLRAVFEELLGGVESRVEVVEDHGSARRCVAEFLAGSEAMALVVAGGGSGTLRAVIEGLRDGSAGGELPGGKRVVVGALRMGSGNPVARWFGVPRDPEAGLRGIVENLLAGRTAQCCVMRCEVGAPGGGSEVRYAATMCGFGQFGRVPGDLERLRRGLSGPRTVAAKLFGIEKVNNAEYVLAMFLRSVKSVLSGPSAAEVVEVRAKSQKEVFPLLAGVAMNFPVDELPVDPETRVEEEAVSLYFAPFEGRASALRMVLAPRRLVREAIRVRLEGAERVEVRTAGRAEFFLDEDPVTFHDRLTLEVAGSLTFAPGPKYRFPAGVEAAKAPGTSATHKNLKPET